MKNVFVYGTLMFDEVLKHLLKANYRKINASLKGYKRGRIVGEVYPGIKSSLKNTVQGVLIFKLSDRDINILDKFESDYYKRTSVNVRGEDGKDYSAEVYLIRNKYRNRLLAADWDSEEFRKKYLTSFCR